MPFFNAITSIAARALGLTSGIIAGPPFITSITGNENGTVGTQLRVYFNAGNVGSSPVTDHQYSFDNGSTWNTFASPQTSSPLIIPALANGTTYSVIIRALQGSQPSNNSNQITGRPVALPSAPTITSVTNDANGTTGTHISLAFTAGSTGTDSTTTYQFSIDNGVTWQARQSGTTASPFLVTGLVNGTTYPVRIRAVTGIGDVSLPTAATSARPVASPGPPSIDFITALTGQLSVGILTGTPGTDAILTYDYSLDGGSTWFTRSDLSSTTPFTIAGIDDSIVANANKELSPTYSLAIRSRTTQNHLSAPSSTATPLATISGTPFIKTVSVTPTSIAITFDPPAPFSGGGAGGASGSGGTQGSYAIASYERSFDFITWTPYTSGAAISGLNPSTPYTIYIRAIDVQSLPGEASENFATTSAEVAPGAPSITSITSTSSSNLVVGYSAATPGTYPVASYEYSLDNGVSYVAAGPSNPFTISGLATDVTYLVLLRAVATSGLRGSAASSSFRVNPPLTTAPTLSFSGMNAASYVNAVMTISKPTYSAHAAVEVTSQTVGLVTSTTTYTSNGNPANFVDNGTQWTFTLNTGNSLGTKFKFRSATINRINEVGAYSGLIYWQTPRRDVASTAKNAYPFNTQSNPSFTFRTHGGTTSSWITAAKRTGSGTTCKYLSSYEGGSTSVYGIGFSIGNNMTSDPNKPGYWRASGVRIDLRRNGKDQADFSNRYMTFVLRNSSGGRTSNGVYVVGGAAGAAVRTESTGQAIIDALPTTETAWATYGFNFTLQELRNVQVCFDTFIFGSTHDSSCVIPGSAYSEFANFYLVTQETTSGNFTAW